jgi:hypothetical protein
MGEAMIQYINIKRAFTDFAALAARINKERGRYIMTRFGQPLCGVVSIQDLERLEEMDKNGEQGEAL